jgi:hypothetical protein
MEMRDACLRGHFYQPPREHIIPEAIEDGASAESNYARNARVTRSLRGVFRIGRNGGLKGTTPRIQLAGQAAEKVLFVIPSEARGLFLFAKPKKKQIPRANPALQNDSLRVFPQPLERAKG